MDNNGKNTKFRMYFGVVKTILVALVIAACLAVVILDIVLIIGTDTMKTSSPVVAGVSMGAAVLITLAGCLFLFNSYYRFDEDKLVFMLGFFSDKVEYSDIDSAAQNTVTREVFITVKTSEGMLQSIRMNLSAAKADAYIEALKDKCPFLIVELFTPKAKDKKD